MSILKKRRLMVMLITASLLLFTVTGVSYGEIKHISFLTQEGTPECIAIYREIIEEFETINPDIRVELQYTDANVVSQKIALALTGNMPLDIINPGPADLIYLAGSGMLLPLDDVVSNLGGKDAFKARSLAELDGNVFALPYAGGGPVLWYRKDLLEEEGIKPPKNWDELLTAAEKLTKDTDNDGTIDQYGIALPASQSDATHNFFTTIFLWSAGTETFNKDLEVSLNVERAKEALEMYTELLKYAPSASLNYKYFELIDAFTSGKVAMIYYWGRTLGRIYNNAPHLIGNVGVVPNPSKRIQVTMADYNYYAADANTKYPEAVKKFLTFLLKGENAAKFLLSIPGHLTPMTKEQTEYMMNTDNVMLKENPEIVEILFSAMDYGYLPVINAGGIDEENLTIIRTGVPNPDYRLIAGDQSVYAEAIQHIMIDNWTPEYAAKWIKERIIEIMKDK
jgi:multiple sugar transport system substrate-binding protein